MPQTSSSSPNSSSTNEPKKVVAGISISIKGETDPPDLMEDILYAAVEESLHLPSMFTLIIKNDAVQAGLETKMWKHEEKLQLGEKIEIGFGQGDRAIERLFKAEITAIETHFTEGSQAPIIIRGYDISHRLHRGRYNRSFQNIKDSDIVKTILNQAGIASGQVDETSTTHKYVFQENQTNMEFLRERAARVGFEFFIQEGKGFFRKSKAGEKIAMKWLTDLTSFQVRVNTAEQVKAVEVRGWDYLKKQGIIGRQEQSSILTTTDHKKGYKKSTLFGSPELILVDQPVYEQPEADALAQALMDEMEGQFVQADAKAVGNPKIRPGSIVKLKEIGKYSGEYYVTETRHLMQERHYTTEFSVRGLRGGDFLTQLLPATHLQPGQTLMIGLVTNNKDPEGLGRVRVKFPTLSDKDESWWARVVTLGAGPDRGFDCLPEIDDEVLVGFEHGDIHRPFIIGNVWNGKDKPPEKVGDSVDSGVRLRTFKTRTGHTFQFVEEDKGSSKAGVRLTTNKGHQFYFNDSEQCVEIKTKGGHSLKLDDRGRQIMLKSTAGHSLTFSDPANVELKSVGNMTIKATGILTIQGAMIKLN